MGPLGPPLQKKGAKFFYLSKIGHSVMVIKLENKCNFISIFFVLMHFIGKKKKLNDVIHSVYHKT